MRLPLLVSAVAVSGLVACKDDNGGGGRLPDAPMQQIDAAIDAPPDPPDPPPPVKLTITRNGAPVAGVRTYFVREDGSVAASVDTDAQGVAMASGLDGGSVTALDPFRGGPAPEGRLQHDLRTFAGVKAGDELVLSERGFEEVAVTLTVKEHDGEGNEDHYRVVTTCGADNLASGGDVLVPADPSGTLSLSGCNGAADFLIMPRVEALALAWLYRPDVTLTNNGTVALTGVADVYQALGTAEVRYTNVTGVDNLQTTYMLGTARGHLDDFSLDRSRGADVVDGSATVVFNDEPAIPGGIAVIATTTTVEGGDLPDGRRLQTRHRLITRRARTETYGIDMAAVDHKRLPDFVTLPDTYNPTTRRISWVEQRDGALPDLTVARIFVNRERPEQTSLDWVWTIAAPYTPGEIRYPTLPTDIEDWSPRVEDNVDVDMLISAKVPGRWDGIRARVHDVIDAFSEQDDGDPVGFNVATQGTVVTVEATSFSPGGERARSVLRAPRTAAPVTRAPAKPMHSR